MFNYFNTENYFDMTEALYTWLLLNHSGQWSDEYKAACRVGRDFKPSPLWSESRVESENTEYSQIDADNWQDIFKEFLAWFDKDERYCSLCDSKHDRFSVDDFCGHYIEYSVGETYVTALENNDFSGLSDDDVKLLEDFSKDMSGQFLMTDNDLGFTQCDISGLWSNCIEYKYYKNTREGQ